MVSGSAEGFICTWRPVSAEIQKRTAKYNNGNEVDIINQKVGYLVRGGGPDAIDSIVPMAYVHSTWCCTVSMAARSC